MSFQLSASFCARNNVGKPAIPYFCGQQLSVRSHVPPSPTSRHYGYESDTRREREEVHPLDRCFLHSPLPGEDGSQTIRFEIVKPIRLEDGHTAQLAVVRILESSSASPNIAPSKDALVVDKLYDVLHFDHEQDDVDPFLYIDYIYSHEAAAYTTLKTLQGTTIPKYYGSYTLELPVDFNGEPGRRIVRLILIEWIEGKSMDKLDPDSFPRPERQTLMKEIIDAESAIYTLDVMHRDTYPRNVMISTADSSRRVSIIDFGKVTIGRSIYAQLRGEENKKDDGRWLPGTPISPLLRWHEGRGLPKLFSDWIDWDWQPWLEDMYGDTRDSITDHMRKMWPPLYNIRGWRGRGN